MIRTNSLRIANKITGRSISILTRRSISTRITNPNVSRSIILHSFGHSHKRNVNNVIRYNNNNTRFYSENSNISTNGEQIPQEVIDMTMNDYHNKADTYLDNLLEKLEILSDDYPAIFPEVELNHGVMTLQVNELGPYVINKQPPNKQIWLASPISGPDRFDSINDQWVSLRNNVQLSEVLTKELSTVFPKDVVDLEVD